MNQDSIRLLSELQSLPQYDAFERSIALPLFSRGVNQMLKSLFLRMDKAEKEWLSQQDELSVEHVDFTEVKDATHDQYAWIPETIRASIQTDCPNHMSFTITLQHSETGKPRTFTVYMCLGNHVDDAMIKRMQHKIFKWLAFVNDFVDASCSETVNILLYLVNRSKSLPETHVVLDTEHVNTAFTTTCQPHTNVHIFREEEWYRALIHESFHNLGLDFLRMGSNAIAHQEAAIKRMFPVPVDDIRLYETYCEMWAEVLNVMLFVHATETRETHRIKTFRKYMNYERSFAAWQCVKVLHHNGIVYRSLPEQATQYQEKTQGFSYYVLKCILSIHLDSFFEFMAQQYSPSLRKTARAPPKHNRSRRLPAKTKYTLQFKKTVANLSLYRRLFTKHARSTRMLQATSYMEPFLKKKKGSPFFKTLRMSLIESE